MDSRVLLIFLVLALVSAAGILLAWIPKPKRPDFGAVVVAAMLILLVAAGIQSTLDKSPPQSDAGPSRTPPPSRTTTWTAPSRSMQMWRTEIAPTCQTLSNRLKELNGRLSSAGDDVSTEEILANLKESRDALSDHVRAINRVELPSDPEERRKARAWLDAYNEWWELFVVELDLFEQSFELHADYDPNEELSRSEIESLLGEIDRNSTELASAQKAAGTALSRAGAKGDQAGVSC